MRTEARHNYITKVIEISKKSFISQLDANKLNVNGIILAGCADFKNVLKERLDGPSGIPPRLIAKSNQSAGPLLKGIISSVDISYGGQQGFSEAIEKSIELLKHVTIMHHKKILSKFFETVAKNGDVIFGWNETIDALENGAVDLMIVWEKLPVIRHIIKIGSDTSIIYSQNKDTPPIIPPNSEIIESEFLVDWISEHYNEYGIKLEIVTDSSSEGSQFRSFGIGALLRYAYTIPLVNAQEELCENDTYEKFREDLYGDIWDQNEEDYTM